MLLSEQIIWPETNQNPFNTEHIFKCSFWLMVLESTTSSLKDILLLLTLAIHPSLIRALNHHQLCTG